MSETSSRRASGRVPRCVGFPSSAQSRSRAVRSPLAASTTALTVVGALLLAPPASAQVVLEEDNPGGACTLRLEGGRRASPLVHDREYYASLTLTTPWGGCLPSPDRPLPDPRTHVVDQADGRTRQEAVEETRPVELDEPGLDPDEWLDFELAPEEWPELDEAAQQSLAKSSPEDPKERPRGPIVYVISPKLARAVAKAALVAAGYHGLGADLAAASGRARWSAALPDLRLRAARAVDETARVDYAGDLIGDTRLTGRADLRFEAALTWRLSELIFSGREPALARIQLTFLRQRQEVVRSALTLLFRWQKAQNLLNDPLRFPEERAEAMLAAVEAEVQLAVLTDGWFSSERVLGAPWMIARTADEADRLRQATGERAPKGPSPRQITAKSQKSRPPSDASEPSDGPIAPGEPSVPGVNEPRNAFRDAKQVE